MTLEKFVTKEEFEAMSAKTKGYMVYMFGHRKDQPNIPEDYRDNIPDEDKEAYDAGQHRAMIIAQDFES